jgi:hypothetical protein
MSGPPTCAQSISAYIGGTLETAPRFQHVRVIKWSGDPFVANGYTLVSAEVRLVNTGSGDSDPVSMPFWLEREGGDVRIVKDGGLLHAVLTGYPDDGLDNVVAPITSGAAPAALTAWPARFSCGTTAAISHTDPAADATAYGYALGADGRFADSHPSEQFDIRGVRLLTGGDGPCLEIVFADPPPEDVAFTVNPNSEASAEFAVGGGGDAAGWGVKQASDPRDFLAVDGNRLLVLLDPEMTWGSHLVVCATTVLDPAAADLAYTVDIAPGTGRECPSPMTILS